MVPVARGVHGTCDEERGGGYFGCARVRPSGFLVSFRVTFPPLLPSGDLVVSQFTHPAPQNPVPQRPAPQFSAPPYAVPQYVIPQKKPVWKRWWFIAIVVVVVLGAIGSLGDRGSSSVVSKPTETAVEGVHQSQQSQY